ncbi:hypothetical protein BH10BAC2_BH10BAC2_28840 [soil metagenome]
MRNQKLIPGSIFKVKLEDNFHAYGRILNNGDCAFYDYKIDYEELDLKKIILQKIIFTAIVVVSEIKKGRWPIIGHLDLEERFKNSPKYQLQSIASNHYRIIDNGLLRNSTAEECEGLEFGFVWEAHHIEERINDFYLGRPNEHIEAFKKLRQQFINANS